VHEDGTAQEEQDVEDSESRSASDLEYDLAHESMVDAAAADPNAAHEQGPSVYVATQTKDYDGDYGYDLAHDVPGR